jgi:hydrogenase expression/formation protein HypC
MKLVAVEGTAGVAESSGVRYRVRLDLVDEAELGSYVLVHAGFAIQVVDEEEARETLDLIAELVAATE